MRFALWCWFLGTVSLLAQSSSPLAETAASVPAPGLPAVDRSVNPCDNFYRYACSNWMKNNPIPIDQAEWGRFEELDERNQTILREILEKDARQPQGGGDLLAAKLGTFYSACMDETAANEKGAKVLAPEFETINAIHDLATLTAEVARLQKMGVNAIFDIGSDQDYKDATRMIAEVDQGGLGLPERDYYFKTDAESVSLRDKYVQHVKKMFQLLGEREDKAGEDAAAVMKIETALAKDSMDITSRRDPAKIYHLMSRAGLEGLAPALDWKVYLPAVNADVQQFNVVSPEFFKGVGRLLSRLSYDDWKAYLTWHLVHAEAPLLSEPFVAENFQFFGKTLTGQKEEQLRWKRCVRLTDSELGEALGKQYVERTFGVEGKQRTLQMVRDIEAAMEQNIQANDWMTATTKQKALVKLHAVANKIGYPENWRDYSRLEVLPGDLVGNDVRGNEFEHERVMAKVGTPVDKLEWQMSPPAVNAYYDPQLNNINFPAGILQAPFYAGKTDEALNYGAIGSVVGHELTHGFDDEGRQFDASGNMEDWWTKQDAAAFESRAKCIEDEYGGFVVDGDLKLNGKLTEGENIADNGGLRLAYAAFRKLLQERKISDVDGFTPDQQFFLGFASIWCENISPELKRLTAQSDPHSLSEYRVNGTLENMPEFSAAFQCKAGQPMVAKKTCRVW